MLSDKLPIRWITSFVIGYMAMAFLWWAIQLWRENNRSFDMGFAVLQSQHPGSSPEALLQLGDYLQLRQRWEKNRRMVFAEGLFFTLCLAFGLYMINRSVKREIDLTRQRRNFMLSITHELKSPIAAVRLALETIGKRDLNRGQLDQLCHRALKDSARLQGLVEDLLLAARLESNWMPSREVVDLAALATDAILSVRTRFPQARISTQIDEGLPPQLLDKAGITSVILNLLENAVKYAPEGQPVALVIALENGGKRLALEVRDQGFGIPEAEKQSVFEKFYRIGNEETRSAPGTGLGLYIVQQVVRGHGGRIQLSDNKPQGSVFRLEFDVTP
jgi:two-component system phosphate regulon sensor histidine kinase PhoR